MMHQFPTQAGLFSSPDHATWRPCLATSGVGLGGGGEEANVIGGEGGDIIGGEGGGEIGPEE